MHDHPDSAIPEVLDKYGPATGPELATLLETHPKTVERRCANLKREGRIRQTTGGVYTLVEPGAIGSRQASD
jgi:Mn-dependent DtxR family transcriptional regulator